MNTIKIQAPVEAEYITKDWFNEMPANAILNKKITGCGATEYVIRNNEASIIAMPYVNLVKNKESQHPGELLGVYKGVTERDILSWAESHSTLKIVTTFDSLPRVIDTLNGKYDIYRKMPLYVDEWHTLLNSYDFRHKAIQELLGRAKLFDRVTYLSATPIEQEYMLEELRHLPIYEIIWPNTQKVSVDSRPTNKPLSYVVGLCKKAIRDSSEINLHFFINSTEFIAKVIRSAGLTPEQVRVICSTSGDSYRKNKQKLGAGYEIELPHDPVKKINFYTSTCFEGCDIYDPHGKTYIVSDGGKKHSLVDISTQFKQIAGRIRNSVYKTKIVHIYSQTRYSANVTLEEFEQMTKATLTESDDFVKEINGLSDKNRKKVLSSIPYINDKYVTLEDDHLVLDKNLAYLDIRNFKTCRQIYSTEVLLTEEMKKSGYEVTVKNYLKLPNLEKLQENPNAKASFKELFEEYHLLAIKSMEFSFDLPSDAQQLIADRNPLVREAYLNLGPEKVKALKYIQTNIKRELLKKLNTSTENKVRRAIKDVYSSFTAYPADRIKTKLQQIYDDLGVRRTAKASDLGDWFEIKTGTRTIDGKSVFCYTIIRENIIMKS